MIIYNGKNSKLDFDLYIASKDVPAPTRKTIVETVPYMSGVYDFSFHDGDVDEYEALTVKYSFDVIGNTKAELNEQKKILLNWIYSRGDQKLYDLTISKNEYYEVYHASPSWSENGLQGLLSVEFLCYPFRKTELLTYSHELLASPAQTITLVNEGYRKIIPKIELGCKNIFDMSLFTPTSGGDPYISRVSGGYVYITTSRNYSGDGKFDTGVSLKQFCSQMQAGETYMLTARANRNTDNKIFLNGANVEWHFGTATTVTQEMLNSTVCIFGYKSATATGETHVGYFQIEHGTTATEYAPFVDGVNARINFDNSAFVVSAGRYDGMIVLEKGENKLVVSGAGTLYIEYFAEVLG